MVKVKIVQVIIEGVLDFLSNFEETQEEECSEGCSGNSVPSKLLINLEGKEQKIEPECHPEVSLVSERKRRVSDALEVRHGILKTGNIVHHARSNCRLQEATPHQVIRVARKNQNDLKRNVALHSIKHLPPPPFRILAGGLGSPQDKPVQKPDEPKHRDVVDDGVLWRIASRAERMVRVNLGQSLLRIKRVATRGLRTHRFRTQSVRLFIIKPVGCRCWERAGTLNMGTKSSF